MQKNTHTKYFIKTWKLNKPPFVAIFWIFRSIFQTKNVAIHTLQCIVCVLFFLCLKKCWCMAGSVLFLLLMSNQILNVFIYWDSHNQQILWIATKTKHLLFYQSESPFILFLYYYICVFFLPFWKVFWNGMECVCWRREKNTILSSEQFLGWNGVYGRVTRSHVRCNLSEFRLMLPLFLLLH